MSERLSSIFSEFETEEQANRYNASLRAKMQASLDDESPNIPHDKVMAEMKARLAAKRGKLQGCSG